VSNSKRARPRKPQIPASLRQMQRGYQCDDCASTDSAVQFDPDLGIWMLSVLHEDSCPLLTGQVDRTPANVRTGLKLSGGLPIFFVITDGGSGTAA
jgi:hypothetical protein